MVADANPAFEVATIKPSIPTRRADCFGYKRESFLLSNTTLSFIIQWAYGLASSAGDRRTQAGQEPTNTIWRAFPTRPVSPASTNGRLDAVRKLLADRFRLAFHYEKRELSVYTLDRCKDGSKLIENKTGPAGPRNASFRGAGKLPGVNMAIDDLVSTLQRNVLDRAGGGSDRPRREA